MLLEGTFIDKKYFIYKTVYSNKKVNLNVGIGSLGIPMEIPGGTYRAFVTELVCRQKQKNQS